MATQMIHRYFNKESTAVRMLDRNRVFFVMLLAFIGTISALNRPAHAQDIWEYSPYRVQVWVAIDPRLAMEPKAQERLIIDIERQLELTFGAAWSSKVILKQGGPQTQLLNDTERFTTAALESSDLVAIVPKKNEKTDTIRSMEAVLEKATEIAVPQELLPQLTENLGRYPKDALLTGILGKLKSTSSSVSQLKSEMSEGKTLVALLPRQEIPSLGENIRSVTLRFPWQMDSILKDNDKIFFVAVRLVDGQLALAVRELDCPTRWFSPTLKTFPAYNASQLGSPICRSIIQVFAPIARLEESSAKEAKLLGRAFGLITSPENPAMLRQGDVLQPIIRRDDRNGLPTLLEPVPWTYVAVTDIENEFITAAVFSGIRGGLEGRRNKRTQRVALKVRPTYPHTDLKLGTVGSNNLPLTGTEVYFKQPGGDDLSLLGRTDWRGIYRVSPPKERVSLTIKPPPPPPPPAPATPPASSSGAAADSASTEKASTDKAANDKAAADKAAADQAAADGDVRGAVKQDSVETAVPLPSGDTSSNASTPAEGTPENAPTGETRVIPLNHPLIILYVKNGDTVLARLPIVVGVDKLAVADTPNDLRRLEAEGFLRGLQSEIIDVVAARQIMAARIRMRLKENKVNDATELLDQFRLQRNYKGLVAELDEMQKSLKSAARGPMPPMVEGKIERMFIQTRELVQKYLQDKLEEQLRQEIEDAKQGKVAGETAAPAAPSTPPPAAPATPATPPPANNSSSGSAPPASAPPVGNTPNNGSNGGMREPVQPSSLDG